MALKPCKECGKEISTEAEKCPHCGAKLSGKFGCLPMAVIAIIVIGAISSLSTNSPPAPSQTPQTITPNTTPATEPENLNTWQYGEPLDEVSGKKTLSATLLSNNSVDLDFPYEGGTQATLVVRKHPRDGLNVYVVINKGQLSCQYDNCYITIRFDDGEVIKNYVSEPTDKSNLAFFLSKTKGVISNISKSKKMYIELTFFSQGIHAFEFNTQNFNPDFLKI